MGTDGLLQSKRWTPDGTPEINKQWTIYTQQGYSFSYKKDGSLAGVANGGSMSEPMIFTYGSDGLFCVDSHNGHVVLFNGGPASLINPIFDHWGPGEDKWKYPPGAPLIGYPTFTADKPGMGPPISIDVSSCLGGSQVASEATSLNQPSFVVTAGTFKLSFSVPAADLVQGQAFSVSCGSPTVVKLDSKNVCSFSIDFTSCKTFTAPSLFTYVVVDGNTIVSKTTVNFSVNGTTSTTLTAQQDETAILEILSTKYTVDPSDKGKAQAQIELLPVKTIPGLKYYINAVNAAESDKFAPIKGRIDPYAPILTTFRSLTCGTTFQLPINFFSCISSVPTATAASGIAGCTNQKTSVLKLTPNGSSGPNGQGCGFTVEVTAIYPLALLGGGLSPTINTNVGLVLGNTNTPKLYVTAVQVQRGDDAANIINLDASCFLDANKGVGQAQAIPGDLITLFLGSGSFVTPASCSAAAPLSIFTVGKYSITVSYASIPLSKRRDGPVAVSSSTATFTIVAQPGPGLDTGLIVGISIAGVVLIVVGAIIVYKRRESKKVSVDFKAESV
ncbi:hypothetical protein BCR33DRAFT_733031 [Rhizoclosmatium globosum]|uniref:Uncharacterized protein n=1 Tax=Rhizoclosmatium globosum TaxID=329046 RepID=A0A1Y2D1Y3_9FUNG|nr:hypothetical protein BCR33DRAFT_733031 [Rhizoclosmatium globosum]|eukprot:ORY53299.1 hypothetical protein BCR33DRAFT_733031 [Rhizoclosmatium globosum]